MWLVICKVMTHLVFGPPFMKFWARKCCQKLCTFILRPLTFLCRCKSTWLIHLITIRYPFLMGRCRLGFNYAFLTLSLLWNSSLHASNSSMSHEVLIVSLSSAYFHLERSYLADARACCCWTTTEERFNCWGTGDKLEKRQKNVKNIIAVNRENVAAFYWKYCTACSGCCDHLFIGRSGYSDLKRQYQPHYKWKNSD